MMMTPTRSVKRPVSRGLAAFFLYTLVACTSRPVPVEIQFTAEWDGQRIHCSEDEFGLNDLRFFVSDVVLTDSEGRKHTLNLTPDLRWQQGDVGLLDFENGEGGCLNGSRETNTRISGTAATRDIAGIQFTIGVPFEKNHANPLLAKAPLNDPAMHWHWRSGYKFMRAGVTSAASAATKNNHWIHLGSTGCEGTVQNITSCRSPNRVTVVFSDFSPTTNQVVIDLAALFGGNDLIGIAESDCSSGPSETRCGGSFAALGLPFGNNVGGAQHVFRVK